jgi:hypothetical protein
VIERSEDQVAPCVVYTMHMKMRSTGFFVER